MSGLDVDEDSEDNVDKISLAVVPEETEGGVAFGNVRALETITAGEIARVTR